MAVESARAKTLFMEASDLGSGAERSAYLDRECVGEPELRARVETLLAAYEGAGRRITTKATGVSESATAETLESAMTNSTEADQLSPTTAPETQLASDQLTAEHRPDGTITKLAGVPPAARPGGFGQGQVIAGRYMLRDVLGEGGMGTVYRADQTEPVKRQVALKLIKIGIDSRTVLARFDAERQALALMDHPNIARVYDGGTTAAGQPFFVMELVKGVPITEYCDRQRLPVKARLELFVAACQAVQHAHQKGIIHRDLKPSNILVTEVDGRPTPKVIDFGVAMAKEFKLTDQSLADAGAIVGTPTYMSPEQADPSSMDIDTRTDVYALGVILYELLTGSPPIEARQFKRGAILEMLRMVRELDPPKPSTKVSTAMALPSIASSRNIEPAYLERALRGDLDWIVMKALEKDRTRRYETANGFAADVMRHLANEPVVAAPPGRAYRLRKFVRKHRGGVIAASLVVFALLAGMAGTTWGLIRASKANAELATANIELAKANSDVTRSRAAVQARYDLAVDAIKTFHTGVSEDFLLKEEKFKDLRDRLLNSASVFYEKLGALLKDAADLASRRALLQANYEVADLTNTVGRKEAALAAHRRVLAAQEALAADPRASVESKADVGRSLTAIATLLEGVGKTAEAVATYRKADGLLAAAAALTPAAAPVRTALADCRSRLGYLLYTTGHAEDGLLVLRQAQTDQEALAEDDKAAKEARRDLANTINRIGNVLLKTGRQPEAEVQYHRAMAIYQRLADDYPAVTEFRLRLAFTHNNLGGLLQDTGKLAESEREFREAMILRQKLADDNPAVTQFRNGLALGHRNLGKVLSDRGRPSEAEAEYHKAMAIYQALADDNVAVTEFRIGLADCHNSLALLLYETGRWSEAEAEFRAAMAVRQKLANDDPALTEIQNDLAQSCHNLGYILADTGQPAKAEPEYRKSLVIYQKLVEDNPAVPRFRDGLANGHLDLGILLSQMGQPAEAEAEQRKAVVLYQKLTDNNPKSPNHRYGLAGALYYLGDAIRPLGRAAEAIEAYERAIAIHERLAQESPRPWYRSLLAHSLRRRGLAARDMGDPARAAADVQRALGLYNGLPSRSGEEWFEMACCHATLAGQAGHEGRLVSAAEHEEEAARAMELLRRAAATGYRNSSAFRTESALAPLYGLPDFRLLMMDLAMPSEPFASWHAAGPAATSSINQVSRL
jgi:tetratricopeptide (TPR) repeat protein